MPTPRNVLGVSSRQDKCQRRRAIRPTRGVTRGTTLHKAAPSRRAPTANLTNGFSAVPLSQAAVGILACLITRREFASPRCVCVLPMSKRRITFPVLHPRLRSVPGGRVRIVGGDVTLEK